MATPPPPPPLTHAQLRERLHTRLIDHYTQLHGTLISITLGAAAFAAAGFVTAKAKPGDSVLMWLFWVGGLLIVGAVYAGAITGVFVLPGGIPSLLDLFIPLGIGLSQFMVFGVLTANVVTISDPNGIVIGWFAAMAAVAVFAVLGIWRARSLMEDLTRYDAAVRSDVTKYRKRLGGDAGGAGCVAVLCVVGAVLRAIKVVLPLYGMCIYVAVIIGVLVFGLSQHRGAAKELGKFA
ncbi:hypothetical protein ABZ379_01160 [Streptomyces canus]|uniref:hypothetical protein n=1 Tax=Streptomyces canus TaxID=58343 RepID=UPI0033D2C38B